MGFHGELLSLKLTARLPLKRGEDPKGKDLSLPFPPFFRCELLVSGIVHHGKLRWNLKITCLKGKIIFQTFSFGFYVNFQGLYITYSCSCLGYWWIMSPATSHKFFLTPMTWRATWKRHIGFHGLNVFHFWDIIHLHIEAKFHFSTSSRFLCNNYSLDEWKTPSCLGHSGGCSHYPWAPWDHEITYEMGIPQPKKQPEKTPRSFIPRRPQVQLAIPTDDPRSWSKLHFFQGFCGQTSGKSTPPFFQVSWKLMGSYFCFPWAHLVFWFSAVCPDAFEAALRHSRRGDLGHDLGREIGGRNSWWIGGLPKPW